MSTKNIMIVGVGGQGSLLASKLLGSLLTDEGYDVKVSEVHGMSQRAGLVLLTFVSAKRFTPLLFQRARLTLLFHLKRLKPQDTLNALKKTVKSL